MVEKIVEDGYDNSQVESFDEPGINFSAEYGTLNVMIDFGFDGCLGDEMWSARLTKEETKDFYKQWLAEMKKCAKEKPASVSVDE